MSPPKENAGGPAGVENESKSYLPANNTTRRPAPAFQMYAASRLADRAFKVMSLAERGLLHTLELECWVNGSVPCSERDMARVLGLEAPELSTALTERVLARFEQSGDELFSPELETYRQKLDENYQNRAAAARKTIDAINQRRKTRAGNSSDNPPDNLTDAKYSTDKTSQNQSPEGAGISQEHREWVEEFSSGEPDFAGGRGRLKPGMRS